MNYCLRRLVCLSLRATVRRASLLLRMALCALFPLLLDACGGTDYRQYPYFDRVEVVAASVPADMPVGRSKSDNAKDVPKLIAGGAAMNAGASFGLGLLCPGCEMFVPGLFDTGLNDSLVQGSWAVLMGMSEEETEQVNAYFEALPKRRDLNQELVIAVSAALPSARLATAGGDARLTLGMRQIQIYQEVTQMFALFMTVEANMEWDLGKKKQDNAQRTYNCFTEYQTPDTWLADSGRKFDEAIDLCLNKVSQQITTAVMKKEGAARA